MEKKRLHWIDFTKGIAVLLMIIGHSIGGTLRALIYTFHMPLFFILSCVTFRFSATTDEWKVKTKKAFGHLVIPALAMVIIKMIVTTIINWNQLTGNYGIVELLVNDFWAIVFASGMPLEIGKYTISAIGLPWFLVALFIGRSAFDYMQMKMRKVPLYVSVAILCVIGVLIGQYQWLPCSIDIILAMMPMFLMGKIMKQFKMQEKAILKCGIYGLIWIGLSILSIVGYGDYLELAFRRYTLFPVCFITAIIGTLMLSEFAVIVSEWKVACPINYIGQYSIYMLFVHHMDILFFEKLWSWSDRGFFIIPCRLAVDVVCFFIVMLVVNLYKKNERKN